MSEIAVLLNPGSGPAPRRRSADEIRRLFADRGKEVRVFTMDDRQNVQDLARRAVAEDCRIVVAGGGDGTVSAVASALVDSEAALGVLPMGTLNHFARDLGIPAALSEAVAVVARERQGQVDAASVNGRTFINNSSIGIYPSMVTLREHHQRRGYSKWVAFARAAVAVLRRNPFWTVRVRAGEQTIAQKTPFVFAGNNRYEMEGLEIGTRSNLNSGSLFLYVAAPISRLGLVAMALRAVFGRLGNTGHLQVLCANEAWIETRRKRVRVSVDGEVLHMRSPLHYRVHPLALKVIVP